MRNVMLGMQASLDDYVATPDGKLNRMFSHIDDELHAATMEALSQLDTILMAAKATRYKLPAGPTGTVLWPTS